MQFGMIDGYGMDFGVMMLRFWIPVIIGLVLLIKYLSGGGAKRKEESALEILQKKYARNTFRGCRHV